MMYCNVHVLSTEPIVIAPAALAGLVVVCSPPFPSLPIETVTYTNTQKNTIEVGTRVDILPPISDTRWTAIACDVSG